MTDRIPPREFEGYVLKHSLGKGGMGEVHLALDTLLDRHVAIKFITSHRADDVARTRFLLEARAFARLQHPNVVSIYRVGEVDGMPFLVSEYVKGYSLDTVSSRQLSSSEVIHIASGIARGLAAAHKQGVIHRDIKPGNVMIAENGEPKLLDFGIAKLLESMSSSTQIPLAALDRYNMPTVAPAPPGADTDTLDAGVHSPSNPEFFRDVLSDTPLIEKDLTRTGTAIGTPRYMAPEVWRGREATFRSDIYSFGALMYFICSGAPPHTGRTSHEIGEKCVTRDAKPLLEVAPDTHPGLAEIVDKCLRRDPLERYATGNDLRLALAQLTPEMRTEFSPEGNPYRGLHPFEEEHTNLFFGRDSEIRLILERLKTDPMVVVVGDSGVGKSSLCRAGVIPRIGRWLGDARRWRSVTLVPGLHPVTSLCAVLSPIVHLSEQEVEAAIRTEPASIARMLRSAWGPDGGVVIFIDQLEELITLSDRDESTAIADLLQWFSIPTPGVRMLATVRGDFLSNVAALPQLSEQISKSLFFLRPLAQERIREAIVGPAAVKNVRFESARLVDMLVRSTEEAQGGLPLLQFTLRELWEVRDDNLISARSLESLGGVTGALSRHADNVYNSLPVPMRDAAKRVILELVTARRTRARKTEKELNPDNEDGIRKAIDAMVSGRLLVAREGEGGRCYEIAHESLLEGWSTLAVWLSANADQALARERLRLAAHDWKRLGYNREALWSARRLKEVAGVNPSLLSESSRRFLLASRRAVRISRLLQVLLVLIAPLAALAIYTSGYVHTKVQQDEKLQQELREARTVISRIRRQQKDAATARENALALFHEKQRDRAERRWDDFTRIRRPLGAWYAQTARHLESAILLDPHNEEAKELYASILYERAVDAEYHGEAAAMEDMLHRLPLYDEGRWMARWYRPADITFHIRTAPGLEVPVTALLRYATDPGSPYSTADTGTIVTEGEQLRLTTGSYLLTIRQGERVFMYPFTAGRGESRELFISLPSADTVPPDMNFIPAGEFFFGSSAADDQRRDFLHAAPIHLRETNGFLIARRETTFGEWLAFLESMPPEKASDFLPRVAEEGGQGNLLLQRADSDTGSWQLTFLLQGRVLSAGAGTSIVYPGRGENSSQDWLKMPVSGISAQEAVAYAEWMDRSGRLRGARLCTELEWERGARGADRRHFPHGDIIRPADANFDGSHGAGPLTNGPDEVGSHPASRSPFDLDDMAGNVWEWTVSALENGYVLRGGAYNSGTNSVRSDARRVVDPSFREATAGLRICADIPER